MNVDGEQLQRKRKMTASIVCLAAGAIIIVAALLPGWIKSDKRIGMKASLYGFSWCGGPDLTKREFEPPDGECSKVSNSQFVTWMKWQGDKSAKSIFGPMGWVTLLTSLLTGLALLGAGGLGLKDRFVRSPVALTTVALLGGCISLVAACVFVATKPGYIPNLGPILGLSWPFFVFGVGVVAGLAGAQMLSKAFAAVSDPYWDGLEPEPGLPPMTALSVGDSLDGKPQAAQAAQAAAPAAAAPAAAAPAAPAAAGDGGSLDDAPFRPQADAPAAADGGGDDDPDGGPSA